MPGKAADGVDRRAVKVLYDKYWTSTGWRDEASRSASREDFAYAKRAGVMFDDVTLSHDEIVKRALAAVGAVDRGAAADAFVVSLTSRRLDLRSALGSFAMLQHFPRHRAWPERGPCEFCGEYTRERELHDLNILNFERLKWGGVRHDEPLYAGFDLERLRSAPRTSPTAADIAVLRSLFDAIRSAPANVTSASLQKRLAKTLPSNKAERDVLIGILGLCDILSTAAHPGYTWDFVPYSAREIPSRRYVDMAYPACWWTGADGLNEEAIQYWFGHLL
jgi:hypothetical protein